MKPKTNIRDLDKQFETTRDKSNKQFETTMWDRGKQFHNSKLKTKILALLGQKWDHSDCDLPDRCPNINHITSGCYNLPSGKNPPASKQQAVYQSLCSLRKEGKVVLIGGVYYKTDDTTAISNQLKRLCNDYQRRKADAEHLLSVYETRLRYFYALYQYINATGSYEGFGEHWSNRK